MAKIYKTKEGVKYVGRHQPSPSSFKDPATCGTCHRTWDDAIVTSITPSPSALCPFCHGGSRINLTWC